MKIKELDRVQLVDGRKGTVVEIMHDPTWFIVDIGSSPADWKTIDVDRGQIVKVL